MEAKGRIYRSNTAGLNETAIPGDCNQKVCGMVEKNPDQRGLKRDEVRDMETAGVNNSGKEWQRNGVKVGREGARGHFNPRC